MHATVATIVIAFAAWTLTAHLVVLTGQSFDTLLRVAPFAAVTVGLCYLAIRRYDGPTRRSDAIEADESRQREPGWGNGMGVRIGVLFVPVGLLYLSWLAFWLSAVLSLSYAIASGREAFDVTPRKADPMSWGEGGAVLLLCAIAALLSLAVSRPDLDDSFYVAVAAFTAVNSAVPVLSTDPMHGISGLPLMVPSYRYATFELLGAAVSRLSGVSAIDAMHVWMPPFWAAFAMLCTLLLSRDLVGRRWLLVGTTALALMVILGECHRGHANFGFVRIFQGKAVYVSAIVPMIYYLTARAASHDGTAADVFLLACAQFVAIGMSNFAMLAAPMAGGSALLGTLAAQGWKPHRRLLGAMAPLAVPVPYLADVALRAWGSQSSHGAEIESAANVWVSVFGARQQYLVAVLLLAGPLLARDRTLRVRLAIPSLILLGLYLNPWLSGAIAKLVTTPPVYWRVVWSVPVLAFAAVGAVVLWDRALAHRRPRVEGIALLFATGWCLAVSIPLNVLRPSNGIEWRFAEPKVPAGDLAVARRVVALAGEGGAVLGPDTISGVVAMLESHPPLVWVRHHYLDLLATPLGNQGYADRRLLGRVVSGEAADVARVQQALGALGVTAVAVQQAVENRSASALLSSSGFVRREALNGFSLWTTERLR